MTTRRREGPFYDDFGRRLRAAAERAGFIQQADLADQLGVNAGTVSRWMDGTIPEPEILVRLAAAVAASIDELLGARATPPTPQVKAPPPPAPIGPPSIVRGRLELLEADEVMLLRLDAPRKGRRAAVITEGAILMVDEVVDAGDTHVVVGRVMNPKHQADEPQAERTGGARTMPLGRQHTGRARGLRRQPALGELPRHDEDQGEQLLSKEID